MDKKRKEIFKVNLIDNVLQFLSFCVLMLFVMIVMFGGGWL